MSKCYECGKIRCHVCHPEPDEAIGYHAGLGDCPGWFPAEVMRLGHMIPAKFGGHVAEVRVSTEYTVLGDHQRIICPDCKKKEA